MARTGTYIFRPKNSANYHIRLQYPKAAWRCGRKKFEKSLGTPDRREAEVLAQPYITNHKMMLLALRPVTEKRYYTTTRKRYEDGEHRLPDGGRVIASHETLIFIEPDGRTRSEPNLETIRSERGITREMHDFLFKAPIGRATLSPGWVSPWPDEEDPALPNPAEVSEAASQATQRVERSSDDDYLETWIEHQGISGYLAREARATWELFRTVTGGKLLKDCDRRDGRKLANHLFEKGNKSATVRKKVGHLCAMTNLAISEGHLKFNPFTRVVKNVPDAEERPPMPEADMALVREHMHKLKPEERLLWMLVATTGMRCGEAYSIDCEYEENGIRFVMVGTKTNSSRRRVPLPQAVLGLLPARIDGPLFEPGDDIQKTKKNLSRNLLRAIRRFGVQGKLKDLHALRHRAKDRLRAAGIREDEQDWILGHNDVTVSDGYGKGPPMTLIKPQIEMIGF